jgi:leukotriene-A4 hydrolase
METTTIHTPRDPNTLSNYNNFLTTHTTANFDIDFQQKRLVGNVVLDLKSITNAETVEIVLDTSYLEISDVQVEETSQNGACCPGLVHMAVRSP